MVAGFRCIAGAPPSIIYSRIGWLHWIGMAGLFESELVAFLRHSAFNFSMCEFYCGWPHETGVNYLDIRRVQTRHMFEILGWNISTRQPLLPYAREPHHPNKHSCTRNVSLHVELPFLTRFQHLAGQCEQSEVRSKCENQTNQPAHANRSSLHFSMARKTPTVTGAASGSMAARRAALIMVW